jgi:hypothetical protein
MNRQVPDAPVGPIAWTERTGGVLTVRERFSLARPLLRGHREIVSGSDRLCSATAVWGEVEPAGDR